jgi:hypothetical protein
MLSARLVQLIERNADEISGCLIDTIRSHPDMRRLARQSDAELREWAGDILENLGYLLAARKDEDIKRRYQIMGRLRFEQSIPLHEAVLRFHLLKDKIIDFVHQQGFPMTSLQLYAEEELEHRICMFFDALVYHVVCGYEDAMKVAAKINTPVPAGR